MKKREDRRERKIADWRLRIVDRRRAKRERKEELMVVEQGEIPLGKIHN